MVWESPAWRIPQHRGTVSAEVSESRFFNKLRGVNTVGRYPAYRLTRHTVSAQLICFSKGSSSVARTVRKGFERPLIATMRGRGSSRRTIASSSGSPWTTRRAFHTGARTFRMLPLQALVRLLWRLAGLSRRVPQLQPEKSRRATLVVVAEVTFNGMALMSLDVATSEGEQLGTPPLSGLAAMASTVNKTSPTAGAV